MADATEPFVLSVLRGEAPCYPDESDAGSSDRLLAFARLHGVIALLFSRASADGGIDTWPEDLRAHLGETVRQQALRELILKTEIRRLLQRFDEAGVRALLLKGMPLAYSLYAEPYVRTRSDTDILIPEPDVKTADRILVESGYQGSTAFWRAHASYQRTYTGQDRTGGSVHIDLHWRLSNTQLFASAFTFDELWASSVQVAPLGPCARAPGPVHALLIACLHRAVHVAAPYRVDGVPYCEANRLIWLWDMHLLAGVLTDGQWSELVALAAEKNVRAICFDALSTTRERFATVIPDQVLAALRPERRPEPSAAYLHRGLWARRLLNDLPALPDWSQRAALVSEWLFPPREHMFAKYGVRRRWCLPFLYLRRGVAGVYQALLPGSRRKRPED